MFQFTKIVASDLCFLRQILVVVPQSFRYHLKFCTIPPLHSILALMSDICWPSIWVPSWEPTKIKGKGLKVPWQLSHFPIFPWVPGPRSCWSVRRKGWWKIESLHLGSLHQHRGSLVPNPYGLIQNLDAPYFMTIWVEKVMIVHCHLGVPYFQRTQPFTGASKTLSLRPHRPHPAVLVWTQVGQGLRSHIRLSVEITNNVHNNRPSQNCSLRNWVYPDWDGFNNHHQTRTEQNSELRTQNINILYYIIFYFILSYYIIFYFILS
jgi:hypothetical protein